VQRTWVSAGGSSPRLVAVIEFAEWTPTNHLRHSKFVALREDKDANEVRREVAIEA
jgi:ATP-dependent DNA ligase